MCDTWIQKEISRILKINEILIEINYRSFFKIIFFNNNFKRMYNKPKLRDRLSKKLVEYI